MLPLTVITAVCVLLLSQSVVSAAATTNPSVECWGFLKPRSPGLRAAILLRMFNSRRTLRMRARMTALRSMSGVFTTATGFIASDLCPVFWANGNMSPRAMCRRFRGLQGRLFARLRRGTIMGRLGFGLFITSPMPTARRSCRSEPPVTTGCTNRRAFSNRRSTRSSRRRSIRFE